MRDLRNSFHQLVTSPRNLGPGIIFALAVIGAGDLVSNSAAGADYGYSLLWMLIITLTFRYVWVGTAAKYVLVTEETLIVAYDRIGRWISWVLLGAIIVLRHVSNLYKIALFGSVSSWFFRFPGMDSDLIWSLIFTLLGFSMMFWAGYPLFEGIFKVLIAAMVGVLLAGAFFSNPDPAGILRGILVPTLPSDTGGYGLVFLLMALIGTEAGSMTNLTYTYFMREKGWLDRTHLTKQRFDLASSVLCMFVVGALVQIAAAGTLGRQEASLESPSDLLRILGESPSGFVVGVFGLGLLAAVFTGFVGATSGYALIAADLIRGPLGKARKRSESAEAAGNFRDPIYRFFVALWALSPIYILFTDVEPIWLLLASSAFSVVVIPFLAFCLLWISNDKKRMGKYVNGWATNAILLLLGSVSLLLCFERIWNWWVSL